MDFNTISLYRKTYNRLFISAMPFNCKQQNFDEITALFVKSIW